MDNGNVFDEKQILDRGKAFQIGFAAALLTICAMQFAVSVLGLRIDAEARFLITLQIPLNLCLMMLIVKDAYECVNVSAGRAVMSIYGAAGLFILISTLVYLMQGKLRFLRNGYLTETIGHICTGGCMLLTCAVYWLHRYQNGKMLPEE